MKKILKSFPESARARRLVAAEFLRLGLKVDGAGRIFVGRIEVPPVKIARALDVDRRVVIETATFIAKDDKLLQIFYRLEPRAFMGNAAKELGFDTIEIRADPDKIGIVAAVTCLSLLSILSISMRSGSLCLACSTSSLLFFTILSIRLLGIQSPPIKSVIRNNLDCLFLCAAYYLSY